MSALTRPLSPILSYSISSFSIRLPQRLKQRRVNPCAPLFERITNAMEAADFSAQTLHKYIKDLEACYEKHDAVDNKKGRASTLYFLTQHLDRQKTKQK